MPGTDALIDPQIVAFAVAAAVLTVAPGPDTMLVVRNVLRGGRGDGLVTTFGICAGLFLHASLSALGVSAVLVHSAAAFQVVKYAGAAYLAWLGLQSLHRALREGAPRVLAARETASQTVSRRRCFVEGAASNALNPKTALFYLAFLPQFIGPADAVLPKSLLLAAIHYAMSVAWLGAVAVAVDRARRLVLGVRVRRWADGLCGIVFLGFGARLADRS